MAASALSHHDDHQDHAHGHETPAHSHDDHGHGHDAHSHDDHNGHDLHAGAHPEPHAPAEHVSYVNPMVAATTASHHDDHGDHEHDDFDTVVIELPEITDPAKLVAAIERLAREQNILRVKGYVAVTGKPMRMLVQAVGGTTYLSGPSGPK